MLALALMSLSGCYRHVVRAEGAAPGRYEIYEPNLADEPTGPPRVIDKTIPTPLTPTKKTPSVPAKSPP